MSDLRESILDQIYEAIDDALAEAPATITESRRNDIRDEVIAYVQRVIEACSTEELRSERAFERFMDAIIAELQASLRSVRIRA